MSQENVEIFIEICSEGAVVPFYAKPGDAGMDVCACLDVLIKCTETVIVPTGLKLAIPAGYEIQVRPRSGMSFNTPLRLANSPGTIDSGYRDELGIIITNTSDVTDDDINAFNIQTKGNKKGTYLIKKGDRIAQIVLQKLPIIKFTKVDSVKSIGFDRGGGFGSTGSKIE